MNTRFTEAPRSGKPHRKAVPVRGGWVASSSNAARQRQALAKLSVCELETGLTVEQLDAIQAEQRTRVLERLGLAA